MVRKLFIVAKGNTSVYGFLQRTVGQEEEVAIIYDRRAVPAPPPRRLARLHRRVRRIFFRSADQLDRSSRIDNPGLMLYRFAAVPQPREG